MLVSLVWQSCSFQHHRWGGDPIDAFWGQCDAAEVEDKVLPALTDERFDATEPAPKSAELGPASCFLVARDLSSVVQMPWSYPYSGMWNAYCPFRCLPDPVRIDSLDELGGILVPSELRDLTP